MKTSEDKLVTGATVTLELGIDIGSLDQVVQIGAPATVSSFAQRLGRCGRRGQIPQLLFTVVDEVHAAAADTLGAVNWEFLRIIAILELYTKRKWIEPLTLRDASLFPAVSPDHERPALRRGNAAQAPGGGGAESGRFPAGVGGGLPCAAPASAVDRPSGAYGGQRRADNRPGGERVVNDYHFLAVFQVPEYYLVKEYNGSEGVSVGAAIGTVDKIYPPQTRFALAGLTWETVEVNAKAKVIFVKRVPGVSTVDWNGFRR